MGTLGILNAWTWVLVGLFVLCAAYTVYVAVSVQKQDAATGGISNEGKAFLACSWLAVIIGAVAVVLSFLAVPLILTLVLFILAALCALVAAVLIIRRKCDGPAPAIAACVLVLVLAAGCCLVATSPAFANNDSAPAATFEEAQNSAKSKLKVDEYAKYSDEAIDEIYAKLNTDDLMSENSCAKTDADDKETGRIGRHTATGMSDAATFPWSNTSDINELYQEVFHNPIYGVGLWNFLKSKQIGGTTLAAENPNLVSLYDAHSWNIDNWVVKGSDDEWHVTADYKKLSVALYTFLSRCNDNGVQTRTIGENWCLPATQLLDDVRHLEPSEETDYQADTVVFTVTGKGGTVFFEFGINVRDKRPELFTETVLTTPENFTPSTPGNPTPKPNPNPTPTPTPTPDPDDTPYCNDSDKDPVKQGNADRGGGKNDDKGPGELQPTDPALPDNEKVKGDDPNSGYKPPKDDRPGAPETKPIPVKDNDGGTDNATGKPSTPQDEDDGGSMAMPD